MRDYSKISPLFWIGETGRRLREDGATQRLALYLLSGPNAHMIGLYYLPLATMAEETGLSKRACERALHRLAELGFAQWDPNTQTVFVVEMASHQIGEPLSPKDNQCKGIERAWSVMKHSPFYRAFHTRYAASYHLPKPQNGRPLKGPSKPLRSQEQEKDTSTSQGVVEQEDTGLSVEATGATVIALAERAAR
jgi:hypothetical protein